MDESSSSQQDSDCDVAGHQEQDSSFAEDGTPEDGSRKDVFYVFCEYKAEQDNQLDLREGEQVLVLERVNEKWWWVELDGRVGYAPASYLMQVAEQDDQWQDEEYYSSYASLKLHLEMLSDKPRTEAYRSAIENAGGFIKDKVVLDFGAGTGILSLFCAKLGGAKKVYAIEASDIAEQATSVVECNGLSGVVTVIQSRGEKLQLPEKVDLIVSEWMGTLLMFELMIESVLRVRDIHLKESGVMWPSEAELFLVPCSAEECFRDKVTFWNSVYGFDFSPLVPIAQSELLGRPLFNHILNTEHCLSAPSCILKLNMKTVQVQDLEKNHSTFTFNISKSGTMHGFGSWFDVCFGGLPDCKDYNPVTLSTSPSSLLTHWKQDLLVMDTPLVVTPGDTIDGHITITRNKLWRRHLRVDLEYTHININSNKQSQLGQYQHFAMAQKLGYRPVAHFSWPQAMDTAILTLNCDTGIQEDL